MTMHSLLLQERQWQPGGAPPLSFCRTSEIQRCISFGLAEAPRRSTIAMAVKRSHKRLNHSIPRMTKEHGFQYVEADQSGDDNWKLDQVVKLLKDGAVGVIPTDTLYALVCDMNNYSAIQRLRRIKNIGVAKPFSILCHSFREIDTYTTGFPLGDSVGHSNIFPSVKHILPGPYTFIMTSSKALPKHCTKYATGAPKYPSRKSVGVRMPDDAICQAILQKMERPLISTSVKSLKEDEWMLDPAAIADAYEPEGIDFVVDGGVRVADPSTVVSMIGTFPTILRQGKGPKQAWMVAAGSDE